MDLPSEIAMGISIWMGSFEPKDTATFKWNWDSSEPYEERFFPMIRERLGKAIHASQSETVIPIEFSYQEIDTLGRLLYLFKSDDLELFLGLNQAFVKAGGQDNLWLRRTFKLIEKK